MQFQNLGKLLITTGIIIALIGAVMIFFPKINQYLNLGRLPGDINIRKENFSFHFPIVSSIIISIVVTVLLNLFFRK